MFVGNVTGEKAHESVIRFDFLDPGKTYIATIYADAPDADYKTNPQAYTIRTMKCKSKTILKQKAVEGGGFAISFEEVGGK